MRQATSIRCSPAPSTCRAASSASDSWRNTSSNPRYDETHGCNYLLAIDIDMEPVPGYKAANWSQGYGDFVMKPDLTTLRHIPWLEKTALVLCDVLRTTIRMRICRIRRGHPEAAVRAAEGARLSRLFRIGAGILPVRRKLRRRARQTLAQPVDRLALHRGLHDPAHHQGRGRHARAPQRDGGRRHPDRELQGRSRVRARKRSMSATPRRWRWPTGTSS